MLLEEQGMDEPASRKLLKISVIVSGIDVGCENEDMSAVISVEKN